LRDAADHDYLKAGQRVVLVGFGVGYSWGGAVIRWAAVAIRTRYRLVPFGAGAAPNAKHITYLHRRLMPVSVISALGQFFMRRFYYTRCRKMG